MKFKRKITSLVFAFALFCTMISAVAVSTEVFITQEMTVFEPRIYSNATIDQNFCGSSVLVVMDKNFGGLDRVHSPRFFGNFPIGEIVDLTPSLEVILERNAELRQRFESEKDNVREIQQQNRVQRDMETFRQILSIRLPIDCKQNVLDVIRRLERVEGIISAEPNFYSEMNSTPNDPRYSEQWDLRQINVAQAWSPWESEPDNRNVRVGIIDSAIYAEHEDFQIHNSNGTMSSVVDLSLGRWFSLGSGHPIEARGTTHGTRVASVVGAVGNNGIGITGVAQRVTLVPLSYTTGGGQTTDNIIAAIDYATNLYPTDYSIQILNFSASVEGSNALQQAIRNYPGLFIVAAGNLGADNDIFSLYPQAYSSGSNVIVVGASTENDEIAVNKPWGSSNFGANTVHLFAPGVDILMMCIRPYLLGLGGRCNSSVCTSTANNPYCRAGGTSFAAPQVAGVAALLYSWYWQNSFNCTSCANIGCNACRNSRHFPRAEQVKWAILEGVDTRLNGGLHRDSDIENLCITGGRLNAYGALRAMQRLDDMIYGVHHIRSAAFSRPYLTYNADSNEVRLSTSLHPENDPPTRWEQRWIVQRMSNGSGYQMRGFNPFNNTIGMIQGSSVAMGTAGANLTITRNADDGTFTIRNGTSGLALTASMPNGMLAISWQPFVVNDIAQKWIFIPHRITHQRGDITRSGRSMEPADEAALASFIRTSNPVRPNALQFFLADINRDGRLGQGDMRLFNGIVYDMRNDPDLFLFAGNGTANNSTHPILRNHSGNRSVDTFANPWEISITGRGGTSQGVDIRFASLPSILRNGYAYEFKFTGRVTTGVGPHEMYLRTVTGESGSGEDVETLVISEWETNEVFTLTYVATFNEIDDICIRRGVGRLRLGGARSENLRITGITITEIPIGDGIVYDTRYDPSLYLFAGHGSANPSTHWRFASNSGTRTVNMLEKSIAITGRGGGSQGVDFRLERWLYPQVNHDYEFVVIGKITSNNTSNNNIWARAILGVSHVPIAATTAATNGTFRLEFTIPQEQIIGYIDGHSNPLIRIGGADLRDLLITRITIREVRR
jgi:hypothetical protein